MAIPILYWMLECSACRRRFVVRDCYLVYVGSHRSGLSGVAPGEGYGGSPLPERSKCPSGCGQPIAAIGSLFRPDDLEMWQHDPHIRVRLSRAQRAEWQALIEEAAL